MEIYICMVSTEEIQNRGIKTHEAILIKIMTDLNIVMSVYVH
jgi:hypothetical protein